MCCNVVKSTENEIIPIVIYKITIIYNLLRDILHTLYMSYPFSYTIKNHPRSKHVSIRIKRTGEIMVTKPIRVSISRAEDVIKKKTDWIISHISRIQSLPPISPKISKKEYLILKNEALNIVQEKIKYFNQYYNFEYKNIFIKNQKTRWGSCSSHKNLNFNCKIIHLKPELIDYIVVHELCHLKHMNHSQKFWNLVEESIPEYKERHREMKSIHI